MTKSRIYLSSPHMGGLEQQFVKEAFDTNWVSSLGANMDNFEADLQKYTGAGHITLLGSGTAAIHLSLIMLGVKAGDVVICQSFTFAATANPITYQGATPVFVDSEPGTWNMDPMALEQAISACMKGQVTGKPVKPKAIIPVHLYGMPAKMEEILRIANQYALPVVEDAAEALGSSINGKRCGTFGKLGILSFNGNKIITTSGGGALLSDEKALVDRAHFLATQARDNAPHYQHTNIGYNYRMSNVVAGIGRGQLMVLDKHMGIRRRNYERYREYFASIASRGYTVEFQGEGLEGYFSNRWLTAIIIDPSKNKGVTREDLRLALDAENIESRPLWKPMHLQPVFSQAPYFGSGLSEKLFNDGLCLPSGSNMTEEDWTRIIAVLDKVFV